RSRGGGEIRRRGRRLLERGKGKAATRTACPLVDGAGGRGDRSDARRVRAVHEQGRRARRWRQLVLPRFDAARREIQSARIRLPRRRRVRRGMGTRQWLL